MISEGLCPQCGVALDEAGLCPRCLMALGLEAPTRGIADPSGRVTGWEHEPIGPYRPIEVLGEGGMGVVYLAEQQDPIERRVALKVIKLGMDTEEVIRRFETERQALALMDHDHIARVLDTGATGDGRPYFAMEYVPGPPITTFCDRRRLAIEERLELFLQVCDAVQHAHQKGLIHRDIKPSNILVAESNGRPVPKVIDFGVARATAQPQRTAFTRLGQLIGTPEYMSPEQAEPERVDVDQRSDVYSLGIVLYELLVGTLPFDPEGLRQLPFDLLLARIRLEDPPRPSRRAISSGGDPETAARNRRSGPRELARRLRGDLDWIVTKALAKDRTRRYQTPMELAADLRRFQNHEPVLAGPPGAAYRLRKFVRRHRWGVAAASLLAVSVLAGAAGTAWQARVATTGWRQARLQAERAGRVTEFLMELFEASNPDEAVGETITARQLLERGVGRAEELAEEPELQAQMLQVMGRAYQRLGDYPAAQPLLERALTLRRGLFGDRHEQIARSLNELGTLQRDQGLYEIAERALSEALAMRRELFGDEHEDVATTLVDLGRVYQHLGDHVRAEPLYRESLAIRRKIHGEVHEKTAVSLNDVAMARWYQGDLDEAEPLFRQSLAISRAVKGERHPHVASVLGNLALVLHDKGDLEQAEAMYREALALDLELLGPEHPSVANAMHNLAYALRDQGKYEEALDVWLEAVRIARAALGATHLRVATYLGGLARVRLDLEQAEEAEILLRQALTIDRQHLAADHEFIALVNTTLGLALFELGRYDEAEQSLLEAHAVLGGEQPGATNAKAARDTIERLVALYDAWGRPDRAAEFRALQASAHERDIE